LKAATLEFSDMSGSGLGASGHGRGQHLILYDGVCGLCNRLIQFVLRRDAHGVFDFASLQSATGRSVLRRSGLDTESLTTFYVVTGYRSESPSLLAKSGAALFAMSTLKIGAVWLRVLLILPRGLVDLGYELVARNRYRLFGRMDRCLPPSAEFAERFIDV
jgi:predicted DCC family thiol-disulfide oxidoreductase YuxK